MLNLGYSSRSSEPRSSPFLPETEHKFLFRWSWSRSNVTVRLLPASDLTFLLLFFVTVFNLSEQCELLPQCVRAV